MYKRGRGELNGKEDTGRNREIGLSRENNDFSFVTRSVYVKARRAGFSRRDSSSGPRDSPIFFPDAPRESIFYVDRAERAARPRRRWLFSPWRTKTL